MRLVDADAVIKVMQLGSMGSSTEMLYSEFDVVLLLMHTPTEKRSERSKLLVDADAIMKRMGEESTCSGSKKRFSKSDVIKMMLNAKYWKEC